MHQLPEIAHLCVSLFGQLGFVVALAYGNLSGFLLADVKLKQTLSEWREKQREKKSERETRWTIIQMAFALSVRAAIMRLFPLFANNNNQSEHCDIIIIAEKRAKVGGKQGRMATTRRPRIHYYVCAAFLTQLERNLLLLLLSNRLTERETVCGYKQQQQQLERVAKSERCVSFSLFLSLVFIAHTQLVGQRGELSAH